ncbi:myelin-oligodendrocyte glycoprotein-like [Oreochromis aureus]|uniref:myelin-oligodendrocyte glycoprotein-like n=1 Tax=Oreochromis aureus TaxID=47969 RepID=UPI00195386FB|nr:myelin-oligodendrocyte glycoprotein-like [Oreochromis aureus]
MLVSESVKNTFTAGQAANTSLSSLHSQMESPIIFLFVISGSVALQQNLQVKLGEDITLQCQITTDEKISVLKWSRPDLNTDGYVYFYRNKRSYENYQHPSFHGRVKLRDPEMTDGDVSLILNNITFNDTGMYECHVAVRNPVRSKRLHTEISHFIDLTVTGETDEKLLQQRLVESEAGKVQDVGDVVTPTVIMVVCYVAVAVIVVGFLTLFIFKRFQLKGLDVTVPDNALL